MTLTASECEAILRAVTQIDLFQRPNLMTELEWSALFGAKVLAVMRGWQPIETAPHNKRVILGWRDWRDGQWCAEVARASQHGSATHWMPLSQPPEDV